MILPEIANLIMLWNENETQIFSSASKVYGFPPDIHSVFALEKRKKCLTKHNGAEHNGYTL